MTTLDNDYLEPAHESSATATVLESLELYGFKPSAGDPDPRPLPDLKEVAAAISEICDILVELTTDTPLDADLEDLLWHITEVFHKKATRLQRRLAENEDAQRRSQEHQDGSEIQATELERLTAAGRSLLEINELYESMRDTAADRFETETGSAWRPRAGSLINHKTMTAALIDSRDYLAARRRVEIEPLLPAGPKIVFAGGPECNDHSRIWAILDKTLAKHPDMVLVHGGNARGAEKIASLWADNRKVTQIVYKPDWKHQGKAAPFKRNDQMLELAPIGVIIFPGNGITDNLADKAKKFGISLKDERGA